MKMLLRDFGERSVVTRTWRMMAVVDGTETVFLPFLSCTNNPSKTLFTDHHSKSRPNSFSCIMTSLLLKIDRWSGALLQPAISSCVVPRATSLLHPVTRSWSPAETSSSHGVLAPWIQPGTIATPSPVHQQQRHMRQLGAIKLHCSSCRYVIRRYHVPLLGVDCNANVRHKQTMSTTAKRPRPIPEYLQGYLEGNQCPRHPFWKAGWTHSHWQKRRQRTFGPGN